ncbi:radical SAM-linked protein [Caldanaerobius fijiensis DSM 17918]|uniref:Radical SAM-linked protein n=1 Tax=Caldanaerobius fijiensis DSM 17918 TaxID=1121256 RepID=A0A1M4YBG4_9THEO|nr:TIGR03936 family radical SAM-associated protein [Caldanaerobius fijiensis]SHF02916.1 radical SAM-linked protein [Caldanaerobius fijiensis DSM 17918]
MRLRIKFEKKGDMRYISHLDLMRTISRAIRRALLPIAYTQGFNPQPKISVALPLTLGYTSDGEYMDMELIEDLPLAEVISRLNDQLPDGLKIKQCIRIENINTSLMALIRFALYGITFEDIDKEKLMEAIQELMNNDTVLVKKNTKSGIKEVNIRPDIVKLYLEENTLFALVSAGSQRNLNPDLVLNALDIRYKGIKSKVVNINRFDMYDENMRTPFEV